MFRNNNLSPKSRNLETPKCKQLLILIERLLFVPTFKIFQQKRPGKRSVNWCLTVDSKLREKMISKMIMSTIWKISFLRFKVTRLEISHMVVLPYKGEKGEKLIKSLNKHVKKVLPENHLSRHAYSSKNLGSFFNIKYQTKCTQRPECTQS